MTPEHRQLRMARFAMHKIRLRDYGLAVLRGQLTMEQGAEEYRKAMENFDQIMELAVSEPERIEACERDMARCFYIDTPERSG